MKSQRKPLQKYQNIHQQFKPMPPAPLKKLTGVKTYQNISKDVPTLQLEKVIGMSSRNNNSITINPVNGDVAYPAGCVICIYNARENKQIKFLYSQSYRSYSCIAYSHNGRYFAAGEGAFRQPEITIWEINQADGSYEEIKHLKGHKYGIESVVFSPNLEYLISLGDSNDRGLIVWDWQNETRLTSNKLGKPVCSVSFSEKGDYFVTAGLQHLKYWFLDQDGKILKQPVEAGSKEAIMESKSADLTKVKVKVFVGVCCKKDQVFTLATDGHLYIFDRNRKLQKWMNIKVEKALSCTMTGNYLFCGCSDGIIRVFAPDTLSHIVTLPKPPPLGTANIEAGATTIKIPAKQDSKFADTAAVIVDERQQRVVALYSDRMVFIWDIHDLQKISVYRTFMYHCGPIHDIQYIPNHVSIGFKEDKMNNAGANRTTIESSTQITKFVTCSSDRTIRFWHFVDPTSTSQQRDMLNGVIQRNAYNKDMSKMIYVKSDSIQEGGGSGKGQYDHFKIRTSNIGGEDGSTPTAEGVIPDDKVAAAEMEQLLRCISCSPDWRHIASGDWTGNIRIHDLHTLEELQCIQAHENEVVCLAYSQYVEYQSSSNGGNTSGAINTSALQPQNKDVGGGPTANGGVNGSVLSASASYKYLLASGSRDRLTQIFDVQDNAYDNITILEDHSSTIMSVKFSEEKSIGQVTQKRIKFMSCGADKQIVFRNIEYDQLAAVSSVGAPANGGVSGNNQQKAAQSKVQMQNPDDFMPVQKKEQCKNKVFTMDVAQSAQYLVTGHDKLIQLWQLATQEKIWEKRPESVRKTGSQDQIKVFIDPYASLVIASSTDKQVTLYEAATGNQICRTACGEITTSMCLSSNYKHLITTSAEGIIYIWKMPEQLVKALEKIKREFKQKEEESKELYSAGGIAGIGGSDLSTVDGQRPSVFTADNDWKDSYMMDQDSQIHGGEPGNDKQHSSPKGSMMNMLSQLDENNDAAKKKENVQHEVADILSQINKVSDKIEKIQPRKKTYGAYDENEDDDEDSNIKPQKLEQSPARYGGQGGDNSAGNIGGGRRRNNWGVAPGEGDAASGDKKGEKQQLDENLRPLNVIDNKLPRWAQSVAEDPKYLEQTALAAKQKSKQPVNNEIKELSSSETEEIEDIFSSTLAKQDDKKLPSESERQQSKASTSSQQTANNNLISDKKLLNFYGQNEEEEDKRAVTNEEEDDEEEIQIKQRMKKNKMKKMYGYYPNDQEVDTEQANKLKKMNENRTSLSQQFFKRKLKQSDETSGPAGGGSFLQALKQQQNKQDDKSKVEDMYETEISAQKSAIEESHLTKDEQVMKDLAKIQEELELQRQKTAMHKLEFEKAEKLRQEEEEKQKQIKARQKIALNDSDQSDEEKKQSTNNKNANSHTKESGGIKVESNEKQKQIDSQKDINKDSPLNSAFGGKKIEKPQYNQLNEYKSGNDSHSQRDQLEESSYVQIEQASSSGVNQQIDEAAFNAAVKTQLDTVNKSLLNIIDLFKNAKKTSGGQQQQMPLRVNHDVGESVTESINNFNSLMFNLNSSTGFSPAQMQSQQSPAHHHNSMSGGVYGSMQSHNSFVSQISVKDDFKDLLKEYSEQLLKEVSKLAKK